MRSTPSAPHSRHHLRTALTMTAAAGALVGCDITPPDESGAFFGPATRGYVILDGSPTELGLPLTETALSGLVPR